MVLSSPNARPAPFPGALVAAAWLTAAGLGCACAFHLGWLPPRNASVVLIWLTGIAGLFAVRVSRLSLLPRMMIVSFCAPFAASIGYLFFDDFLWWFTDRAVELQSDPVIIREMLALGLIGVLGLVAGMLLARARPPHRRAGARPATTGPTLELLPFAALAVLGVVLSWLSAPGDSILQVAVGQGTNVARSRTLGFAGAWLASYILLLALALDVERERHAVTHTFKVAVLASVVLYVVVFLQLLQGDREVSGLLLALAALYLTPSALVFSPRAAGALVKHRLRRITPVAVFGFLVLVGLGSARYSLADRARRVDPVTIVKLGMGQNTWTGVLLTNLGSAYEYRTGIMHFVWGGTYLDYALSLPPGIITRALGVERPLEPRRGGGSQSLGGVTGGGIHAVVIPFENFGAPGVFVLLALFGFWIARAEQAVAASYAPRTRLVWASVFCVSLFWFWYGDMNIIRALMGALVVWPLYRVALGIRVSRVEPPVPALAPACT